MVALLSAGCGKTREQAGGNTGDGDSDAASPLTRFPVGAIATRGFAAAVPPSQLLVYPPDATAETAPIAVLDEAPFCLALAFDSDGTLYDVCGPPAPAPAHIQVFTAGDASGAPHADIDISGFGFDAQHRPASVAIDGEGTLYVERYTPSSSDIVVVKRLGSTYSAVRTIGGDQTQLTDVTGLAADASGQLFVADQARSSLFVFAPGASGNVAPVAVVATDLTPVGVAVDRAGSIYVSTWDNNGISVYKSSLTRFAVISGPRTELDLPSTLAIDEGGRLLVPPHEGVGPMKVFPADAGGDTPPIHGARSAWGAVAVVPAAGM
jgi:hypothetical protein